MKADMPKSGDTPDLCIIGGGAAGLATAAAAAAQLGASVVLIERGAMDGECLNSGCVPSKALLAAAHAVQAARAAARIGIDAEPKVDFARVCAHVKAAQAAIAPHDSRERFEGLGVEVISAEAHFINATTVQAGGRQISARHLLIATGSSPKQPKTPGLQGIRHSTNETIFQNPELPAYLAILGGGPVGIELAQAFLRLGSRVTVIADGKALPKDDVELTRPLLQLLAAEGLAICEDAEVTAIDGSDEGVTLRLKEAGRSTTLSASHLLVATGRKPRTAGLGLEAAGIRFNEKGVEVDAHLRTSNRAMFAAGDVVDGSHFTHVCSHHADIVIRNALLHLPASLDYRALPWVTYTEPELAQVGAERRPGAQEVQARDQSAARAICQQRQVAGRRQHGRADQSHGRRPRQRARHQHSGRARRRASGVLGAGDHAAPEIERHCRIDPAVSNARRDRQSRGRRVLQTADRQGLAAAPGALCLPFSMTT